MTTRLVLTYDGENLTNVTREAVSVADYYSSTITFPTTGSRGTKCLRLLGGQVVTYAIPANCTEIFMGLRFLAETGAAVGSDKPFLNLYNAAAGRFGIQAYINAGRRLVLVPDATSAVSWESTTPVASNGWYHFGLHLKLHASAGVLAAHFDGGPSPDTAAATGKTNDNPATYPINTLQLSGPGSTNDGFGYRFEDVYLNDNVDDGVSDSHELWGDYKLFARPFSGNGSNTGLTRSAGSSDSALLVDNSDSTYLYGTSGKTTMTSGAFGFTASDVKMRAFKYIADKEDAASRELGHVTRVNGTDYDHATTSPLGVANKRRYVFMVPRNPETSAAWTQAEIEDADSQAGPKIV